jgi:hypothetical protein
VVTDCEDAGPRSAPLWATDREVVWQTATVAVTEVRKALTAALSRLE